MDNNSNNVKINKSLIVVIVVLILSLIGAGIYIAYDARLFSKDDVNTTNNNVVENNTSNIEKNVVENNVINTNTIIDNNTSNVTTNDNQNINLPFYDGIESIALTVAVQQADGRLESTTKTITDIDKIKNVLAILSDKVETEVNGLGGMGLPYLVFKYKDGSEVYATYYGVDSVEKDTWTIDGKSYSLRNNSYNEIKNIIES